MSLVVLVVMVITRGPGVIGSFILIRVKILVGTRVMARISAWISFVVNITLVQVFVIQFVDDDVFQTMFSIFFPGSNYEKTIVPYRTASLDDVHDERCKGLFLGDGFFNCISSTRNKAVPDPGLRKPHRSASILIFIPHEGGCRPP